MKLGILAARLANAIDEIARKTGIDVSPSNLPKTKDSRTLQMLQLEKLSQELPEKGSPEAYEADVMQILESVRETKGVGEALYERIEKQVLG